MELELKKTSLDAYETGGELTLTQEETAETIVPDYLPDIARIIETEGRVFLHSRELRDGKAEVSGTVQGHGPLHAGRGGRYSDIGFFHPLYG